MQFIIIFEETLSVIDCKNASLMKKIILILIVFNLSLLAQFREDANKKVDIKSGITNYSPSSLLLGFINPQNFQMNHSFNMSYTSFGGEGLALGIYTNSMSYQFAENLNIEADISFVNSPYSSLGEEHSKQLNGIYLSRAQLNYKPSENMFITIQYNQLPYNYGFYSPYKYSRYSPFYRPSLLEE